MKILITGSAGFIGFHLAQKLLKNKKYKIIGIDNLNNYYDIKIKNQRNRILKKNKNYNFFKIDISNNKKVEKLFKKYKFDFIFHLAAQAGVRYSIDHPREYIDNNFLGFFNIIENSKKYKIKRLFYASSSSVYGESKSFPLNEKEKILPKNIYGLSKKVNEEISSIFNKFYSLKLTGLRFFTVYGEWGRPDMMIVKFISSFFKKQTFNLYNYGNHTRDFTYVGDVVEILQRLLKNNKNLKDNDILNICSNKPINLKKIISFLIKHNIKPKIKKLSIQKADILKTHGDNSKLFKYTKFKNYSDWKICLKKVINWYQNEMI